MQYVPYLIGLAVMALISVCLDLLNRHLLGKKRQAENELRRTFMLTINGERVGEAENGYTYRVVSRIAADRTVRMVSQRQNEDGAWVDMGVLPPPRVPPIPSFVGRARIPGQPISDLTRAFEQLGRAMSSSFGQPDTAHDFEEPPSGGDGSSYLPKKQEKGTEELVTQTEGNEECPSVRGLPFVIRRRSTKTLQYGSRSKSGCKS